MFWFAAGRHISLCTPWLHQRRDSPPQSSEQWPAPLSRLCVVQYEYEKQHEESGRTDHAVWSFLYPGPSCRESRKYTLSPQGTPEQPPPRPFSFAQWFVTSQPAPGDEVAKSGDGRWDTVTTHSVSNSTSWEVVRLRQPTRPAHASPCKLPDACCKDASSPTAGRLSMHRVLILSGFVPPPAPCELYEFLCRIHMHDSIRIKMQIPRMQKNA